MPLNVSITGLYLTCNDASAINTYEIKDGAYFCDCAYVLRISRYSGFLWVVPESPLQNIFCGLKLCDRKWNLASALGIQKKNWG